ncbi:MAG: PAS domain S-box protein [Blastocatellia bacterium]|nr:PAS domain S-box protein [Blastocatellia bacterium]
MSTLNDIDRSLRTALGSIASGASLDSALEAVTSAIRDRTLASSCKIWLVKPGDVCDTCALVDRCADRSMCLHFKASAPHGIEEPARVPLTVFRDRVAARGGVARIGEPSGVGRMLFPSSDVSASAAFAAFPLKGPAGVLGLIAVMRSTPFSHEETDELRSFSDVAVLAVRVADLTSRLQRASYQIGETAETRAEVESLLHAILFGSPEHAVVAEDLQGNITVFGEGARVLYGYEPDEVIGRAKSDVLFAPEEVESGKIVEILNEVMHTGRCESVITRIRKNGERFPSRATITVRRDPDGDPAGFVIVERDLSKERDTARLGESSARQVAQLEDTVVALKSANALLERDVDTLRRQSADLAARASHAFDADEVTAIRIETIRELKGRVAELQSQLLDATTERDALVAGLVRQNASAELSTPSAESHGNAGFRVLADLSQGIRSAASIVDRRTERSRARWCASNGSSRAGRRRTDRELSSRDAHAGQQHAGPGAHRDRRDGPHDRSRRSCRGRRQCAHRGRASGACPTDADRRGSGAGPANGRRRPAQGQADSRQSVDLLRWNSQQKSDTNRSAPPKRWSRRLDFALRTGTGFRPRSGDARWSGARRGRTRR